MEKTSSLIRVSVPHSLRLWSDHSGLSVLRERERKRPSALRQKRMDGNAALVHVPQGPASLTFTSSMITLYRGFRKYRIRKYRIFRSNGHFGNPPNWNFTLKKPKVTDFRKYRTKWPSPTDAVLPKTSVYNSKIEVTLTRRSRRRCWSPPRRTRPCLRILSAPLSRW